jgi:hypothetical protein
MAKLSFSLIGLSVSSMEKKAIQAAAENLAKTKAAMSAMRNASTFEQLESAWSDFLIAAHRIYTKLEQGAKVDGRSIAWFGRKKNERSTNTLLQYIHHARNADEHGLIKITKRKPFSLTLGVGPGAWEFNGTIGRDVQMKITPLGGQVEGVSKAWEYTPGEVQLVPVTDRGVQYDPPLTQNSEVLSPLAAAGAAISQLQLVVEEAQNLSV